MANTSIRSFSFSVLWFCFLITTTTHSFVLHHHQKTKEILALNLSSSSIQETSDELVNILISSETSKKSNKEQIKQLVDILVDAKVSFNPIACLDDELLYFSNVIDGPSPLWERFGWSSGNIQGQQYTYGSSEEEKSVINYAEIFGDAFHVRAYGTYERDESSFAETTKEASTSDTKEEGNTSKSFLAGLLAVFNSNQQQSASSNNNNSDDNNNSLQCPADFVVSVTKGSILFGSKNILDIPISGTGYLRVLYADSRLRIFVSPKSTTDDRWEKAGLMVAQVRVDLKDPTFQKLS